MATIPERRNIMWTLEMDSVLIRFLYDEAVLDEIDDTGDEGMPFPPFTQTDGEGFLSDMGIGTGSSGAKLRHRRATKDIAQSFQTPDYVKLGEIMSQIEDLTEEDVYAAMDVFSTRKESDNVFLGLSIASRSGWLRKKIGGIILKTRPG
ncbi:hypothetical protein FRX31_013810 [Thalictrum thalictroides]|uniref:Uncharacterized protein n=1 Tax=Thalictrum thalictroides TaxID=46969 RepID=A0A7J6WI24_THATH|nr:hypothetical protein FRX31_013810 [Thalictrum thalictroides]